MLFIDHLTKPFTREQLKSLISEYGVTTRLHLLSSKDRAFVSYENPEQLIAARDGINGLEWVVNKKTLKASICLVDDIKNLEKMPSELIGESDIFAINGKDYPDIPKIRDGNRFRYTDIYVDRESMTSMTDFTSCLKMTNWIVTTHHKQFRNSSKTFVIDITAGVGGTSIAFGKNKKVGEVISIERDPTRFKALQQNTITMSLNEKIICHNRDSVTWLQEQLERILKRSILFIDPPLKPDDIEKEKVFDVFLLSGENDKLLNSVSVLQLIEDYVTKCKLIAVKLPLNFDFGILFDKYIYKIYKADKIRCILISGLSSKDSKSNDKSDLQQLM